MGAVSNVSNTVNSLANNAGAFINNPNSQTLGQLGNTKIGQIGNTGINATEAAIIAGTAGYGLAGGTAGGLGAGAAGAGAGAGAGGAIMGGLTGAQMAGLGLGAAGVLNSSGAFGGNPSMPGSGDLVGAAQETAAGNLANAQAATLANRSNISGPTGTSTWSKDPTTGQWTQTNTLNPALQGMVNTAQSNYAQSQATPLSVGNLVSNVTPGQMQMGVNNNANQMITGVGDPNLLNQNVTNALYQQQTSMLDPQFQRQQSGLENQLANQGITRGSEAWNNAMQEFNMNKNNAYQSAMNSAIGQGVGAANTLYGNQLAGAGFTNQALQGQFGQGLQAANFANNAQAQQFGQGLQNAALQNSAAQQGLQGNMAIQQNYANQLNGLYALAPQGTNYNQQATAGADILGALQTQNQYNQGQYNAQLAGKNATTSGLFALGAGALSDERTKENIIPAGERNGYKLFEFEYKPEFKPVAGFGRYIGVMAQDVEKTRPDAVITGSDGIKRVLYGMLGFDMVRIA